MLFVWRLSRTSGVTGEQGPRKTEIGTELAHVTRDSDTTFKIKGQLVADVLNSQHVGIGATWRINISLMLWRDIAYYFVLKVPLNSKQANKRGGGISWRPPAYSLFNTSDGSIQ